MSAGFFRRIGKAGMAVSWCAAWLVAAAPSSPAAQAELQCQAGGTAHFTPALLPAPVRQTVMRFDGQRRSCSDMAGSGVRQGTFGGSFAAPMSCTVGGTQHGVGGTGRFTWRHDDGTEDTSEAGLTLRGQDLANTTVAGTIHTGRFTGKKFAGRFSVSFTPGAFGCTAGMGLRAAKFIGNYTIS